MADDRLIGRGERAPDFALPRDGGRPARLYGLVGGRPAVLLFSGVGGTGESGARPAALDELAVEVRDTAGTAVDVHLVAGGGEGGPGFSDPDGEVHRAYGVAAGDGPVAVVLDHNVRVVATQRLDRVEDAAATIVRALPRAPADVGHAPRLAPVLFVPDAVEPSWCERLMALWASEGAVETGVETVVEGERAEATDVRRKRRRDLTVTDQDVLRGLTRHVGARVIPEVQKAFAFQAGGFEGFKIGCYDAEDAGFFEAHRDNLSAGTAHRRFGLTLNLNDDYEGGELRFPEYGVTRYRPIAGEALVFSGSHLHEVLPVTAGRRFVLLSFLLPRRAGAGARGGSAQASRS